MSFDVVIEDGRGERVRDDRSFPLSIGGRGADIELAGAAPDERVALVGWAEAHPFIQPADSAGSRLQRNGTPLADSCWIENEDLLRLGEDVVRCELGPGRLVFRVSRAPCTPVLSPPRAPPPGTAARSDEALPAVPRAAISKRRRHWNWLALASFAVLVLAASFVFVATSVSVQITPAPESQRLSGVLPVIALGERYLAYPGRYTLIASRRGYHELRAPVDVRRGEHQEIALEMKKLPGILNVSSKPIDGARVTVDGRSLGLTPLRDVELSAGPHTLSVTAPRYLEATREIDVEGLGKTETVEVQLTPAWAEVTFSSMPPDATVLIAGEPRGKTPITLELDQGQHSVEIAKERYDAAATDVTVVAGRPQVVPAFVLRPSDARVQLTSTPSGANVTVDGEYRGRTPVELALRPGPAHRLKLTKPGYVPRTQEVQVEPAETTALSLRLKPRVGVIFVTAEPADAELFVDGKPAGLANQRLRLPTLPHVLEVKKSGYKAYKTTVTPRAGVSQKIEVKLVSEARARAAAAPETLETGQGQTLRLIRPGRFRMGGSRREPGRRANESLRRIELTRAYYLSEKEVTNAEFRRFLATHDSGSVGAHSLNGDDQPVVNVTWEEAAAYLNWLSKRDSLPPAYEWKSNALVALVPPTTGYRLPTEAEWAHAARYDLGKKARKFPWGSGFPPTSAVGNFADRSAEDLVPNVLQGYDDGHPVSAQVGRFPGNARGLFDLGGNVAEWCHDFYAVYPNAADKLVKDPLGPVTGKHHVVRGSSWRHASITELRLTYRDYHKEPRADLGFRIARYAAAKSNHPTLTTSN